MVTTTTVDDRTVEAAQWYVRLKRETNPSFWPLMWDQSRYLVLKGGGGSGKSIFAGRKIIERCAGESGHRFLVCRKVARTIRESCYAQLLGQISDLGLTVKSNATDLSITFQSGSQILFAGLDDVEKLKSIYDITGIWVEEASEITEDDFNQLDIRLRTDCPYYLQMILTFNPISITHWLKRRFFDRTDDRARVHESNYRDNQFLTPEAIRTLEAFKETDLYYYTVYCLGQWGVTGKTIFDAQSITDRLAHLPKPIRQGTFDVVVKPDGIGLVSCEFVEDGGGITIFENPKPGNPYVIGADTAGDGSDWFVAHVLDNVTGKQVAVLRQQYDEDSFTRQLYCLGAMYNTALIGIEANYSTYPNKLLGLMGYKKIYIRRTEDRYDGAIRPAYGVRTDRLTRPVMIGDLVRIMRDHIDTINDETTLLEMLTFVRNEDMRPEAEPGAHDDCVMALAIAHYIRDQQTARVAHKPVEGRQWTADQWHDYTNADESMRRMMIEDWGTPRR